MFLTIDIRDNLEMRFRPNSKSRESFYVTSVMGKTNLVRQQKLRQKKNQVCCDCYSPYIRSFVWLKSMPEDLYVELLCFITVNWKERPSQLQNVPMLKYMTSSGSTGLPSVSNAADRIRIYLSS
jgi:hypothetical protein